MEDERTEEMAAEPSGDVVGLMNELVKMRTETQMTEALLEAGAKNVAAVKGVLADFVKQNRAEDGSLPGLKGKLAEMAKNPETAFLFKGSRSKYLGSAPGETGGNLQSIGEEMGYEAQLNNARESGDFLNAIRIKQEAAKEGIILI